MPPKVMLALRALLILAVCCGVSTARAADPQAHAAEWLRRAVAGLCPAMPMDAIAAQLALDGSWLLSESRRPETGPLRRQRIVLLVDGGDELHLDARFANGRLVRFRAGYHATTAAGEAEPRVLAVAGADCIIRSGRALRSAGPVEQFLDHLEADLETLRWSETLQAPWPSGSDPGGARIGLVDSGLAYDLEPFRNRLARDGDGLPLGYDFWDDDPYPYDGDMARGAFFPIRHGTAVASVLLREAPEAALVPFRYPRPDMGRMADLVDRAEAASVRILALPLGSNRRDDWTAFEAAMRGSPILAIVSAGNNGRDIDRQPVWPAALGLDNMIVVTSADGSGRLAPGSNWGRRSVDVLLPAETVPVIDFRGAQGIASGSSYAVPRLAALAARILAAEPGLSAADLKARVLARAVRPPLGAEPVVAAGWIPDPAAP